MHGNYLTITHVVYDPVILTEPLVRSQSWFLDPGQRAGLFPCEYLPEVPAEAGTVPHYLPGANPVAQGIRRVVRAAVRGDTRRRRDALSGVPLEDGRLQTQGQVRALLQLHGLRRLPVAHRRPMKSHARSPLSLSIASCGLALWCPRRRRRLARGPSPVRPCPIPQPPTSASCACRRTSTCSPAAPATSRSRSATTACCSWIPGRRRWRRSCSRPIRTLSNKPIHTIVNTHLHADHTGGNQALVKLGAGGPQAPRVMGHENTYNRMMAAAVEANANTPASALPMNTYFTPTRDFFLNGEASCSITCRPRTPTATRSCTSAARTSSPPATSSIPTSIR